MSENTSATAHCLCHKVKIHAANRSSEVHVCHCGMCRRWGGSPLFAVYCGGDVKGIDHELVGVFQSSDWAERGFCKNCGTHLFYRIKANQHYIIPAGLFEDQQNLQLTEQIYIDHKPNFYDFANVTPKLTEAEFIAKFSGQ